MDVSAFLHETILGLALFIEVVGALVIVVSVSQAVYFYIRNYRLYATGSRPLAELRFGLGRGLVLGLEFLIGADILRTIFAPTWQEIGVLAAIIAVRTVLSFSIEYELAYVRRVTTAPGQRQPPAAPASE